MDEDTRNVQAALASITEHWQPHRLTSINDYDVKVVKLLGEFVWHTHPDTDELFMVVQGELTIQLRDRDVVLGPNDVFVVPKGVEHCPARRPRGPRDPLRAEGHRQHGRCRR
nr:cupin domain-containing protein [Microbacterium sp. STF-2]